MHAFGGHGHFTLASASDWDSEDEQPLSALQHASSAKNKKNKRAMDVKFQWKKGTKLPNVDTEFAGQLPDPPDEIGSPLSYFQQFLTPDLISLIVSETNRYAAQCGSSFVTYEHQVERYIGILMKMGIVQLPRYRLYWSTELRYGGVADYMSRDDFDTISRFIHFNDNAQLITNRKDDKYDALYKVRPLLDILRSQCLKVEPLQK